MKFEKIFEIFYKSPEFSKLSKRTKENYIVFLRKIQAKIGGCDACFVDRETARKTVADEHSDFDGNSEPEYKLWLSRLMFGILLEWKTPSTQKYARTVLVVVLKFALKASLIDWKIWENIPEIKVDMPNTVALSQNDVVKIKGTEVSLGEKPYKDMLLFCFYSGLRPNEAENLLWRDVDDHVITVRFGKGKEKGKPSRLCRITEEIKSVLPARSRDDWPVFISLRGEKLNKDTRSIVSRRILKAVGSGGTFYSSRRGTATEMFKSGKYDILDISNQLGHSKIETTMRYIRPTMIDKAASFVGF